MRRKLSTLAAALSLALCVATAVLWVRSYSQFDSFFVSNGQRWCCIDSHRGSLSLVTIWWRSGVVEHWKVAHSPRPALIRYEDVAPRWHVFGFQHVRAQLVVERGDTAPNLILNAYSVPFWSVCLLFFIATILLTRSLLRASAKQTGRCALCGYDLRASPDRCPECGHVPETSTS